jgi:YebC/PmpR family DNA-binding regulatory protein
MSGHSKWATTHRQKAIVDAKRGAVFTKLANVITIAARKGGDPSTNANLRTAIDKARGANMPKDNIERAIKKGTGELGGAQMEELFYEAIGPANSQFVIKCITDNKNRSAATVRHTFTKYGGALASVLWNFEYQGVIILPAVKNSDDLELALIDLGINNFIVSDDGIEIQTKVEDLNKIKDYLESQGLKIDSAEIEYVAKDKMNFPDSDSGTLEKIMEELEDNEDVSDYYTNIA